VRGSLIAAAVSATLALASSTMPARGTFFLFQRTNDYLVVAIDSRYIRSESGRRVLTDDTCKIRLLDDRTIFFLFGMKSWGYLGGPVFDAYDEAQREFNALGNSDLSAVARSWGAGQRRSLEKWHLENADAADVVARMTQARYLMRGYFAMSSSRSVAMYGIGVLPTGTQQAPFFTDPVFEAVGVTGRTSGHADLVNEILAGRTSRAELVRNEIAKKSVDLPEIEQAAVKLQVMAAAILRWAGDDTIGGDVAVVVLERGQPAHWLHKPAHCR
jgi:hypothetical protein